MKHTHENSSYGELGVTDSGFSERFATPEDLISETADTSYLELIGGLNTRTRSLEKSDHSAESAQVVGRVYERNNENNASLTAREPENIAKDLELSVEELFPKDGKVVYIGDPWQAMAKYPNVVTVDYKFGDVALFSPHPQFIVRKDNQYVKGMVRLVDEYIGDQVAKDRYVDPEMTRVSNLESLAGYSQMYESLLEFRKRVSAANEHAGRVERYADAKKLKDEWSEIRSDVETIIKRLREEGNTEDESAKDKALTMLGDFRFVWYKAVEIERHLKDLVDWNMDVVPKIKLEEERLKQEGHSQDEIKDLLANFVKSEIEEIRLKKKHEQGKVVVAVFPELPFVDESFDRFIASWSISTESLPNATEEDYKAYWQEIERVLKVGGKAYIYPLTWGSYNPDKILDSISRYSNLEAYIEETKTDTYLVLEKNVQGAQ